MKLTRLIAFTLAFSISFFSCKDDEPGPVEAITIPEEDITLFDKIQRMGAEAETIWPGYDYYRTLPAYILLSNDDQSEKRGYLLNPVDPIPNGSVKLDNDESKGLNLYRNDAYLAAATEVLGTSVFNFYDFKIGSQVYFLIRDKKGTSTVLPFYDNFQDVDNNWLPLVTIHEMFHVYQFGEWTFPPDTEQDFAGYPVTAEVATVELALFELMKTVSATASVTTEERKEQLAHFVVLMEELFRVDPTDGIIERMAPLELFLEGSARYMEHYSALNTIYPTVDQDVTHGWADYIENIEPALVRHFLSIRVWYHVGSGALYQLDQEGLDIATGIESGETAYSIARDYLNLSDQQKAEILAEIKSSDQWKTLEDKGKAMAEL